MARLAIGAAARWEGMYELLAFFCNVSGKMTMLPRRISKRMYAVSCDGVGLIAGTLAYSRRDAIALFIGNSSQNWNQAKEAGYRTVMAMIKIIKRNRR